jgi:hypothetical protein
MKEDVKRRRMLKGISTTEEGARSTSQEEGTVSVKDSAVQESKTDCGEKKSIEGRHQEDMRKGRLHP